jgi:hypothetical protein
MDIFDNKTNTMYFYTQKIASIQNYTNIVIMKSEKVNLPLRPLNQHKITLFNHSGKTILIDTNSTSDLMHSQMYAPRGEKTLFLEDKRMIKFIYLTLPNNTKFGFWHISIG